MARPTRLDTPTPAAASQAAKPKAMPRSDDLLVPAQDFLDTTPKPSSSTALPSPSSMGLTQFLDGVADTLRRFHGMAQWVQCEVAFVQAKNKGYWMLGLQETNTKGQKQAAAEAIVWSNDADRVMGLFERVTGEPLAAGMRVLLRVELSFSAQWGLRLICKGIEPRWTLGETAQARAKLRQTLIQEGLWDTNRRLTAPADFTRLAVVSPEGSAGVEDFLRETALLEKHRLCQVQVFHAPFEGNNASAAIPAAFERITEAGPFDAVCVVRGGGAASGIAWLDHEAIVRAALACPFPLVTGIGHERDNTLLDDIALLPQGTPSKAAAYITQVIVERARAAEQAWESVSTQAIQRLDFAAQKAERLVQEVFQAALARIDRQASTVDALLRESIGLGPQATLERGYALALDGKRLVTSAQQALEHPQLTLRFADGSVNVTLDLDPPP